MIAVCSTAVGISGWGQASAPAPANSTAKTLTYEVVSIKPDKLGNRGSSMQSLPDGFRWTNFPIVSLIRSAYGVFMESQILGLPGWAESDPYDIEAKVDADTAEALKRLTYKERWKQQEPMLQSLLADRCQLKSHLETRNLPVYDLVIAKGGLKMKEAPADEKDVEMLTGGKMTAHALSTDSLVYAFSGQVGRMIVDKTGLAGKNFDFELKWTPEDQRAAAEPADQAFKMLANRLGRSRPERPRYFFRVRWKTCHDSQGMFKSRPTTFSRRDARLASCTGVPALETRTKSSGLV